MQFSPASSKTLCGESPTYACNRAALATLSSILRHKNAINATAMPTQLSNRMQIGVKNAHSYVKPANQKQSA